MSEDAVPRSAAARIGVAALNLLGPGLGLIRAGRLRTGLLWIGSYWALLLLALVLAAATPVVSFRTFVATAIVLLLAGLVWLIGSIVRTWQVSAYRTVSTPWWARWHVLAVIVVALQIAQACYPAAFHAYYKPFYIPSVSMEPTLLRNDKMMGDMRWRTPHVGDVVLFRGPDGVRVVRVAAQGGQTIAMEKGVPIVDGRRATQQAIESLSVEGVDGVETGVRFSEHLPGEAGFHSILRIGDGPFDETAPQHVPPGYMFVLGDNRDRAADSRVSPFLHGAGLVPVGAIIGRPLFIHWSRDRSRIGQTVNH